MDNKDKDLDKELGKQPELETIPSSHPPTLGETEAERKEKKRKLLKRVAVTIGIIIILLFLFRGCLGSNRDQGIDPGNGTGLEIDKNIGDIENMSKKDIVDDLNRKVAEGMLNISMNLLPVFEDGASEGNLLIINENINNYPQVIEIYRDDTEELVYKSGLVPVGSQIGAAKLDKNLAKGEYECTAYFIAIDEETQSPVGKAGAKIKLVIEN